MVDRHCSDGAVIDVEAAEGILQWARTSDLDNSSEKWLVFL